MTKNLIKTPNFFIIGAPKCGTTSLAAWLAEHPQIYISSIKEPFYFSNDIQNQLINKWEDYLALFSKATSEHLGVGEASTAYLFSKSAVPNIENRFSDSLYIVMLRNPVEMAYALHEQQVRIFAEDIEEFRQAWQLSTERRVGQRVPPYCKDPILLDYKAWCHLGEQLGRLYSIVPRERVLVLVLDDVKRNPRQEYLKVLEFLGITDDERMQFPVHNAAHEWRSLLLGRVIKSFQLIVFRAKYTSHIFPKRSLGVVRMLEKLATRRRLRPKLSSEFHGELVSYYKEDIQKLEKLLKRDLSYWYDGNSGYGV